MTDVSSETHPPNGTSSKRNFGGVFAALASHIQRASAGERAALSRLNPDALRPHEIAALSRALVAAGLHPESWRSETWPLWALISHGIALSGHLSTDRFGRQMAQAGISESRITRLLTARGEAFRQLVPRVLRLLASKGVQPNWFELGELILKEASIEADDQAEAERLRLNIAGSYFSSLAAKF